MGLRGDRNKRLTILSEAEKQALYELPDFDDFQRTEFLALTDEELALVLRRKGVTERVYCLLQIGYFKAKRAFFSFDWKDVPIEDITSLLQRYFPGQSLANRPVRPSEVYAQRREILALFGYRMWEETDRPAFVEKAILLSRRDVSTTFLLTELLSVLTTLHIVRPGYSALQEIISQALTSERERLHQMVMGSLNEPAQTVLNGLLVREDGISGLAAIKGDAKHFGYQVMQQERHKHALLTPIYQTAKQLLPSLEISHQNISYYASLIHYYTIYDLRRLPSGQSYLYLLCYAWQRYRQLNDNLIEALGYHMKKIEDDTKEQANKRFAMEKAERQPEGVKVGQLLLLYVDEHTDDDTQFGEVRRQAFEIMPRDDLQQTGQRLCEKPSSHMSLRWQEVDQAIARIRKHLRPLAMALDFASNVPDNPILEALHWMKQVFAKQQSLSKQPLSEVSRGAVPSRLREYLLEFDSKGNAVGLKGDRFEFWIYRQLRKRLEAGQLYLDDSISHRRFSDELVAPDQQAAALAALNIPWLQQPIDVLLDGLFKELHDVLLSRYLAGENQKVLEMLKKISPVAWQHIRFLGHYTFRGQQQRIDVEALPQEVELV